MRRHTLSLFVITLLLASLPLIAQPPAAAGIGSQNGGRPGARAEGQPGPDSRHPAVGVLIRFLDLTEEQSGTLRGLADTLRGTLQSLHEQAAPLRQQLHDLLAAGNADPTAVGQVVLSLAAIRDQGRAAFESFDSSFTAILTPEQQTRYQAFKAARRAFGHRSGPGGPGGADGMSPGGGTDGGGSGF